MTELQPFNSIINSLYEANNLALTFIKSLQREIEGLKLRIQELEDEKEHLEERIYYFEAKKKS